MNVFSDSDLLAIITFDKYVKRLVDFSRPLKKPPTLHVVLSSKPRTSKLQISNVPSELRFSALLNSLRPLMLTDDAYAFLKIRKLISRFYSDNGSDAIAKLKAYKKIWNNYTSINSDTRLTMKSVLSIDGYLIDSYAELLDYFIYGKYVHSYANKFLIMARIENNPLLYAQAKMNISECVYALTYLLKEFRALYIGPILKNNQVRIQRLRL